MTNYNPRLVRPVREIKYLLKLRGSNFKKIAAQTGCSYTTLCKFMSETDKTAHLYYKAPSIYKALTEILGITETELMNREVLTNLIDIELQKNRDTELAKRKRHFSTGSQHWSFRRFIKNLIRLGKPGSSIHYHYKKYED